MIASLVRRQQWMRYDKVSRALACTKPFVVGHAALCQLAVREAIVAQMSRNPALMAAFATRGDWFSKYLDHALYTCDLVRKHIQDTNAVPSEDEVAELVNESSKGEWWAGKVYRLPKWDFALRVAKVRRARSLLRLTSDRRLTNTRPG